MITPKSLTVITANYISLYLPQLLFKYLTYRSVSEQKSVTHQ